MTIQNFTVKAESLQDFSTTFVFEPLPQGFGNTLGNALRRVLYSSIPGAAITSVRFNNANHQFTTIPGVLEDVLNIILNLKQVHLAYNGEKPVAIKLSAKGESEIKASDFELPAGVTISNTDLVLAHLTEKNAKLEIEAIVESGLGYSPAEDRKTTTVGTIITDAVFSPILRVNYVVEATRVGRITNFDKLSLTITTDGTITPKTALTTASETLVEYFTSILNPATSAEAESTTVVTPKTNVLSAISVEELDLPTRIANALQKAGLNTVSDILQKPKDELSKIKNLGGKSVQVVEEALAERGFSLQK